MPIEFVSYLIGFLSFFLLTLLLLTSWRGRLQGGWLITASAVTALWSGVIALQARYGFFAISFVWTLEVLHIYVWLGFLAKLLRHGGDDEKGDPILIRRGIHGLALFQLAYVWLEPRLADAYPILYRADLQFLGQILLLVVGLALIEQFYRNARTDQRWRIKFLCFALGALFVYEFYLYSEGVLFHRLREDLWTARGAVAALSTPLIAVSAARNPEWSVDIFVSRQAVFHSAALLGSGAYLLLMATAGYYIKFYGGEWGTVAQIVFLFGAFMVLALVLLSGQIRARVRVFLSKNFFNYIYDYRREWLRLIATLSDESGLSLEQRVILALGQVVESPSGALWMREANGRFVQRATYGDPDIEIPALAADDPAIRYMEEKIWVLNFKEMLTMPEAYEGLNPPAWLETCPHAWLLIPLLEQNETVGGVVLLTEPRTHIAWNWEVMDMLKTTSRLAASYLALEEAAKELAEARQFDGFNRLSAFVIHDLKNLIAQLSLVVSNAAKFQDNPEFMRDAIKTVEHAVGKMNALMSQLRNSSSAAAATVFDMNGVLTEVLEGRKKQSPIPRCEASKTPVLVRANRQRLASALEHVVHNAQDAAGKHGWVAVRLRPLGRDRAAVEVEDNGTGMDEAFIRDRLFKPFETTKGLTGMGIGAYESRECIRSLGGDLSVRSEPGKGSLFVFTIPLASGDANQTGAILD
jgi:putative PEP-CTERM system histidine kinase